MTRIRKVIGSIFAILVAPFVLIFVTLLVANHFSISRAVEPIAIIVLLAFSGVFDGNNYPAQYKSATEFESVVKSWKLDGKSEAEAVSILTKNNITCNKQSCYGEIRGLPCKQRLIISLAVNNDGNVTKTSVAKELNGALPSVCL